MIENNIYYYIIDKCQLKKNFQRQKKPPNILNFKKKKQREQKNFMKIKLKLTPKNMKYLKINARNIVIIFIIKTKI